MLIINLSKCNCSRLLHISVRKKSISIHPFSTNVPLLYPPENIKNLQFSDVFRSYRAGTLVENGLSVFKVLFNPRHIQDLINHLRWRFKRKKQAGKIYWLPCKKGVLSVPFINHLSLFIHPPLFKNVPFPQEFDYLKINQLIKIDDSSIDYSGVNKSILTYIIGYNI